MDLVLSVEIGTNFVMGLIILEFKVQLLHFLPSPPSLEARHILSFPESPLMEEVRSKEGR